MNTRTKKSKGERLNWAFASDGKLINTKTLLENVKGRILTDSDLNERRGKSFDTSKVLVP
jgi:hypothetical protein